METLSPPEATDLPPAEARALAERLWLESGGKLTGAELGPMVGRGERWARGVIAELRQKHGGRQPGSAPTAGNGSARGSEGTPPAAGNGSGGGSDGTAGTSPAAAPRKLNGTAHGSPAPVRRQPAARKRPAARGTAAVPLPLLGVTIAAVVVVTAVCAVVSYSHIRDLAAFAGAGDLAGWLPLGIDGLVVACSGSLIADRRQGQRGHPSAWAGLILGLAATLAANVIAVDPELVSVRVVQWVLAGYAPVALAVSGHLLLRMLDSEDR